MRIHVFHELTAGGAGFCAAFMTTFGASKVADALHPAVLCTSELLPIWVYVGPALLYRTDRAYLPVNPSLGLPDSNPTIPTSNRVISVGPPLIGIGIV